jgi:hypothetical protein
MTWGLYPSSLILPSTSSFSRFVAPDFMTIIILPPFISEAKRPGNLPGLFREDSEKEKPGALCLPSAFG